VRKLFRPRILQLITLPILAKFTVKVVELLERVERDLEQVGDGIGNVGQVEAVCNLPLVHSLPVVGGGGCRRRCSRRSCSCRGGGSGGSRCGSSRCSSEVLTLPR